MEKVVRLCRHRGFIFPSAEIYGGFRSTYDYGPLGVNMLRNVKNAWWRAMVQAARRRGRPRRGHPAARPPSGRPRATWPPSPTRWSTASNCHERWREDKIDGVCPNCGSHGPDRGPGLQPDVQDPCRPGRGRGPRGLPAARDGPGHVHQLRQRAQDHAQEAALRHRPGGQVVPQRDHPAELRLPHPRVRADGDGVLRAAGRGQKWFEYWLEERLRWYLDLGIPADKLHLRHHEPSELSHYSRGTADVEFLFPWGWDELEGIANRGDFDLTAHARPRARSSTTSTRRPTSATRRT